MSDGPGDPVADVQVVTIAPDGSLGPSVDRLRAHQPPGILHLAVSVALVDPEGRWLLQRRAASKAAFPDRWANACCTHPQPGEQPADAARRRVRQELGLDVGELAAAGTFTYQAPDPASGLVEYELDHVFVGMLDTSVAAPDPAEIGELARLPLGDALDLVRSAAGAPWAAAVLELASRHGSDAPTSA
jgi:isopentenyl-diphosphate delta-isomerase